jgi:hypothetical protein
MTVAFVTTKRRSIVRATLFEGTPLMYKSSGAFPPSAYIQFLPVIITRIQQVVLLHLNNSECLVPLNYIQKLCTSASFA